MGPGPFLYRDYPTSILLIKRQAHFLYMGPGPFLYPTSILLIKRQAPVLQQSVFAVVPPPFSPFCVMNYRICNMPMTRSLWSSKTIYSYYFFNEESIL